MKGHEPTRSTSSCAACKFLKRRCSPTCLFAPYFRSDEPEKFAKVHKVFGASNVAKILVDVPENQRDDAVNSLVYEAEARLRDPVYGCIGAIALLQRKAVELQQDLAVARTRLARCAAVAGGGMTSSLSTSSLSVLSDEDRFLMNSLSEILMNPGWDGWGGEGLDRNSVELDRSGCMDELSQLPFPRG
ncbi:LOB domain-containing protein 21-like [Rhododendron vialii]|uniref:LOB domain-containing protein 21-like n=1 Tax=Rhododendron vialii TaxID=182163 RepID=UPI00265EDF55|nr:LOB domain-containing protein 21-like [Rhododendron vialii]